MGDTIKDKAEENEQENESNENSQTCRTVSTSVTVGHLLLGFLVVIIIVTASLVYYMIQKERLNYEQYNQLTQGVSQEDENTTTNNDNPVQNNETIKDIIDSATNTSTSNTTVDAVDATNRKVMNENLIVLYNGLILDTTNMKQTELKYIDNSDQYKDKYVITYYNYESFVFKDSKLGTISSPIYDGLVKIENVSKVAISESYSAIPRDVKVVNALPTVVSDKNSNIGDFDSIKAIITDLDGNGTEEYILVLANKSTGNSKIALYDSSGTKVGNDLAYLEKSKWESVTTEEYNLSLNNLEIIDIDNDGIMEILVEIPQSSTEYTVSLLKYAHGELLGKTDVKGFSKTE